MDSDDLQAISERDQLWASLRPLLPEIDRIAAGDWDTSERQQKLVLLIARIVKAELDYRAQEAGETPT